MVGCTIVSYAILFIGFIMLISGLVYSWFIRNFDYEWTTKQMDTMMMLIYKGAILTILGLAMVLALKYT